MKKSNITGDVAVMERSTGVLARPKTLPLKPDDTSSSSFCYLQLRNRRLHRSPPPSKQPQSRGKTWKPQNLSSNSASTSSSNSKPNSSLRLNSIRSGSVKSAPHGCDGRDVQGSFDYKEMRQNDINEVGNEEASFGENKLELEPRDRSIRESTPCSLITASDAMGTARSNTRRIRSTYHGGRNDSRELCQHRDKWRNFLPMQSNNKEEFSWRSTTLTL
ncbi:cyclin-dependent kinase inhibitor 4-like [Mangifera indica]|uniref:cyclin-dependent kinase inhibitor 4-like n=1 Tax=Mangifera indica TaxID=29780 RepID=UPI001CFBC98D|nr:cyclin-dependent kinase inhibitor 4-like [Mangifera indica]